MPLSHADEIAAWIAKTDIALLELRGPEGHLTLRRERRAPAVASPARVGVSAPSPGVFLHRHPLAETPLVRTGEAVQPGQILGLLRIGPLLLPLTAPRAGTVLGMRADHETLVGFGTRLVELEVLEESKESKEAGGSVAAPPGPPGIP
jgi:acetyl-CoA carboxylase biotin carboxyl carrier protein